MVLTPAAVQGFADTLGQSSSFTRLGKIAAPNTTVVNRALMTNPLADGLPKLGSTRFMFGPLMDLQGEQGPVGQRVWKFANDVHDAVRIYGTWNVTTDQSGIWLQGTSSTLTDSIEITFYGTDLILLAWARSGAQVSIQVDGGSSTNFTFIQNLTAIGTTRGYSDNIMYYAPPLRGLALGVHTVRITGSNVGNQIGLYGYDAVVGGTTNLTIPATTSYVAGKKLSLAAATTDAYNSNFASGSLAAGFGGHVLVYQDTNGQVKKAVTSNSTGALYNTSANHSNEEVARVYHYREFGSGFAPGASNTDFAGLSNVAGTTRAYTLDDNVTSLSGSSVVALAANSYSQNEGETMQLATSATLAFTFVGTGLDIELANTTAPSRNVDFLVDSLTSGTLVPPLSALTIMKVVSGLPYGTHTVRFTQTTANFPGFRRFIVYQPARPALPSGAIALCEYNIMASYSAQVVANDTYRVAQGVLRKTPTHEAVYNGGAWGISLSGSTPQQPPSGNYAALTTIGQSMIQVFYGTGFELTMSPQTTASSITVNIDSVNYTGAATASGSGDTWTPGTSTFVITNFGAKLAVTGLTLGVHFITLTWASGGAAVLYQQLDVITPIHAIKLASPGSFMNALSIGSTGIGDLRAFSTATLDPPMNWCQAYPISVSPTSTATVNVVVPEMVCSMKTMGNPVEISWSISVQSDTLGRGVILTLYVDGFPQQTKAATEALANADMTISDSIILPLTAGYHTFMLKWATGGNTMTADNLYRNLHAKELP